MPEIPLTRVVSVSSADPRHPAENLLKPEDGGSWRGAAAGEKQISVVLELGDPRPIHSLHVGNDGAAFVEVLVGSSAGGEFQVLLPSAALMSPSESRAGAGAGPRRVRLFGPPALLEGPARRTWDRLRVVLSQPYCQSRPYGLSFLRLFSAPGEEGAAESGCRRLGPFTLRQEGEGSPRRPPGALFYRRPSPTPGPLPPPPPGPSYAAAALGGDPKPPKRRPEPPETNGTPRKRPRTPPPETSGGPPRNAGPPRGAGPPPGGGGALGGVVLALSGFQNPLRGHLRAAAAAMGAQYRPEWTDECTHLVCAFPRTPKAERARRGGGVVLGPAWIWACQKEGRRVSCDPYLLDGSASSDTEGEGPEDAPPPPRPSPKPKKGAGPPRPATPPTPPPAAPATPPESADSDGGQSEDTDPYGGSTEENSEEGEGPEEDPPIPPLPDFFQDKTFLFRGGFAPGEERRLRRLAVAFGGSLAPYMDDSVTHVVTSQDWDPAFEEALRLRPSLTIVRPHWLLLCGERQRPLPATPFLLRPRQ